MSEALGPAAASPAAKPATLLLVDDEPSVLSALRRLFRSQGYQIEQAGSGADGLALLALKPVDLVISDMRMPEMDGAAFLEAVRQRHPQCARILLTGYADIGSTVAAINRGEIHRYIAKPWDDHDLLLVVSETLSRRELESRNAQLLALTQSQNHELQTLNQGLEQRVAERTAELAQANVELSASFMMAVTVFSGMLEMRQGLMAGHARRVGELAQRLAVRLGCNEAQQREVHLAALLHDIGKIGYDDAMLAKPVSRYGPQELLRYHRHPLDGEAALMALEQLQGVAAIVRQHHERVDGRGFPDGLVGTQILLGARIVAAASDYDSLTQGLAADRQYTPEAACRAITEGIGSHYDAAVVKALLAVVAEMLAEAQAEVEVEITELKPRMQLARDLLSPQGAILLPAGHKFDAAMIRKLADFAARTNLKMRLPILRRSLSAAPQAAALA